MVRLFAFIVFIASIILRAQPPSGYYNTATGSGYTLKTQLHNIIDGHSDQGYGALWDFYEDYELDSYYENDGTIIDIYSENPTGTDPYNYTKVINQCGNYSGEGSCYNREHSFPKSWFNDGYPMYSDVHHLFPSDGHVNGQRSNFPYGEVGSADFISQNGSKKGSAAGGLGYTGTVFEPIDEFKGDLARAYFYMATRYEDVLTGWSSDMLDGSSDQVYEDWVIDMLIDWHENDAVSQKELDRNDNAYTYQGNRNPFVDHPEWVDDIWGDGSSAGTPIIAISETNFDFGMVTAGEISSIQSYTVSGSNLETDISATVTAPFELSLDQSNWSSSVTINQSNAESNSNNTIYVRFSPSIANGNAFSYNINHSTTNATTVIVSVTGTEQSLSDTSSEDLFFSEYIEGSSFNKALELFNGTGSQVDLSDYKIVQGNNGNALGNGNGTDIEPYEITLSGTLTAGEVFVVVNGEASSVITSEADLLLSFGDNAGDKVTSFNGDDAIGLYKNGILIDLIGENGVDPGSNWSSGNHSTGEKTLVRKATIEQGNPNGFTNISKLTEEWEVYDPNDFSFLGTHTFIPAPKVYTWVGETDQDWINTANWQDEVLPTTQGEVVITNGTYQPTLSTDIEINDLALESGSILTVESGISLAIMGSVSGAGIVNIIRNTTSNNGYSIISSPVSNANIADLSADFIYDYDGTGFFVPSGSLTSGKGYFSAFDQTNASVSISGTPNNGNVTIPISGDGDRFNIVGNPYSAPIDRADFIFENANAIDGNIWLWDDGGTNEGSVRGGDYIVVNDLGATSIVDLAGTGLKGTSAFNEKIGSVQGFLVKALGNETITFKPTMQRSETDDNSDQHYYRKNDLSPALIRISLSGNGLYNETIIGFTENATLGKDFALDAEKFSGNEAISLYSIQQDYKYAIQALPLSEINNMEIDLGMKLNKSGSYQIRLNESEQFNNSVDIYLQDHLENKVANLSEYNSYYFSTDAIVDSRRFSITIIPKTALSIFNEMHSELKIIANHSKIELFGNLTGEHLISIYTIDGRRVLEKEVSFMDSKATLHQHFDRGQLYILKVNGHSQKFVID